MKTRRPRGKHSHTRLAAVLTTLAVAGAGTVTAYAVADPPENGSPQAATPTGQEPGAVYANRPVDKAKLPTVAGGGEQYSYWTTSADKGTHLSVATLLTPKGKAPGGGWPVIVRAPGGHGIAQKCSPSRNSAANDNPGTEDLLRRGYAVITPDYASIGTTASPQYTDIATTAHGMVDAVTAGVVVDGSVAPRWAVLGDSQGAAAAIELARKATAWQGSKLDYRGSAATSIPAGFDDLVAGLGPNSPAVPEKVVADVVFALASLDVDELDGLLSTTGARLVAKARTACADEVREAVSGVSLSQLVSRPLAGKPKLAASLLRSLNLPSSGFNRPLLLSQTLTDDEVVVSTAMQYLLTAQQASNKVKTATYLTPDPVDAIAKERTAVGTFLDDLF